MVVDVLKSQFYSSILPKMISVEFIESLLNSGLNVSLIKASRISNKLSEMNLDEIFASYANLEQFFSTAARQFICLGTP